MFDFLTNTLVLTVLKQSDNVRFLTNTLVLTVLKQFDFLTNTLVLTVLMNTVLKQEKGNASTKSWQENVLEFFSPSVLYYSGGEKRLIQILARFCAVVGGEAAVLGGNHAQNILSWCLEEERSRMAEKEWS